MTTTVSSVVTAVNSGKRDAGHSEQFTSGMDFEDKFTINNQHKIWKLKHCLARGQHHLESIKLEKLQNA
eukprot:4577675-Amphidinium_carterae.1